MRKRQHYKVAFMALTALVAFHDEYGLVPKMSLMPLMPPAKTDITGRVK